MIRIRKSDRRKFLTWLIKLPFVSIAATKLLALAETAIPLVEFLEPALHPNHRKFFHSLTILGALGYGDYKVMSNPSLTDEDKLAILVSSAGYASHLAIDATTPKFLPLI